VLAARQMSLAGRAEPPSRDAGPLLSTVAELLPRNERTFVYCVIFAIAEE